MNLLVILSDEHRRDAMGVVDGRTCTPHLDRLAQEGVRFTQAYTPSPICVPARASLATGRHVHQTRCWDSAQPWSGDIPGWGHQLTAEGHEVVSIGKLHFRSRDDNNGFSEEIAPMHVVDGVGWVLGVVRDPVPAYEHGPRELAEQVGAGDTDYTDYDTRVCKFAVDWLNEHSGHSDKPWVLFVSFVSPHYPLKAPQAFYDRHDAVTAGWPHRNRKKPDHPVLKQMYEFYNYADHFDDDATTKGRRGYFGLTSFLDHNIGQLLDTLDDTGLSAQTRVLYSSDHGEMLGDHGMWTKMLMHEASAGIPMILRGPGISGGRTVDTPVSLIDVHRTVLKTVGSDVDSGDVDLPGVDLAQVAHGATPDRHVISEFHDGGSPTGYTMIRVGPWKYIHYVGARPQLFNLEADPAEDHDLALDPLQREILAQCEGRLREILDPEAVNTQAFADQARTLERLGGRDKVLSQKGFDFGFTPLDGSV